MPKDWPIYTHEDCPPDTIYLFPKGSKAKNIETGEILELKPGYWVNPKQLGKITGIKFDKDSD